ncbi:MAG: ParB/RepB/Spo0J family partition protein [Defluviitaleaceae bacterium]|nr:ParB/RepB/Spo0J family partition protein [Defluviitaleaceae bacterium]MCL2275013.1 ParB/RepB/Spo0J family partition protein [Defluviitaleaceae bacterium]
MARSKDEVNRNVRSILLGDEAEQLTTSTESLFIDDLIPYTNHPFKLYTGERLDDMVRSIKELGVIVPVIVRSLDADEGTYEILSGHNRVNAAKMAELKKVPVIIKTGLTDDEAKLIVTETNLIQRSFADLSHSERAMALRQHLYAIKSQGKRTDLLNEIEKLSNPHEIKENGTSGLIDPKLDARDKAANKYGLNSRSVSRYVRLSYLSAPILQRVDDEEIALYAAVHLSYLTPEEQAMLESQLNESAYKVDMVKADYLRLYSQDKKLTHEKMQHILSGGLKKKPRTKTAPTFKLKARIYQKYFDPDTPQAEIEAVIDQALAEYRENRRKDSEHQ